MYAVNNSKHLCFYDVAVIGAENHEGKCFFLPNTRAIQCLVDVLNNWQFKIPEILFWFSYCFLVKSCWQ
jgi:hypothetical protein